MEYYELMSGLKDSFLTSFCKVEFLCWQGEPNWLGVVAFGFGVAFLIRCFNK
jgi:hypothetical protein